MRAISVSMVRGFVSQQGLELGKRHLDGVQIGTVRRKIKNLRLSGGDGFLYAGNLVGRQIVEHHDIARLEGWCVSVVCWTRIMRLVQPWFLLSSSMA